MLARHRSAVLALVSTLGALALALLSRFPAPAWAGEKPVPARTAQYSTPEPPPAVAEVVTPHMVLPGSPSPVDPPTPVVRLRVRVPAVTAPGAEVEYHICVENAARAEAHHVTVRNPLPANARFVRAVPEPSTPGPELSWNLGTLGPCACREIVLVLAPTGTTDIVNCARVSFEHGQCVTTRVERPASGLAIRKVGPAQAALNQVVTYQIVVSNRGAVPLTNVHVIDKLGDGLAHHSGRNTLAWSLATLQPGQTEQVQYEVTATKPGRLCNQAAVSADGGAFDRAETCVVVGPAQPAVQAGGLALVKQGPPQRFVNRPANYQITVSNPGPGVVNNVVVNDVLPPGTTVVSISDQGRRVGETVQWLLGPLQPGARRTVQIALQAQQPGALVNRATATADGGLTAQAEAKTVFEGATGLTFDIDVKDNPLDVNAQTTFIVTVLNQGMAPATKVQIALTLPEQVQYVAARGPSKERQEGRQVIFEPLETLQPKVEMRYEVNVKALREGEAKVRAELRADQLGDRPVIREQTLTIAP